MTTFALVHGAWHGAWSWDSVTPALEQCGHRVVTMDLPSEDPSAGFDDYATVVCDALRGEDDVVLVGHSMAGQTIPLVAARRPVRHLVYLCGIPPEIGRSLGEQGSRDRMLNPVYETGMSEPDAQNVWHWVDRDLARDLMYADCDDATVAATFDRLRPQALYPLTPPCSLTAFPAVASTYVVCADDRILDPVWSRKVARERLGAELVELEGGHSPLLSRPHDVVAVLLSLE